MDNQLLTGKLVRLTAQDDSLVDSMMTWERDTQYLRLLEIEPVKPPTRKAFREMIERERNERFFPFLISALADKKPIGFVVLMNVNHIHGDCSVGIGIGDSEYRSKGYGSDAMNVALRFAFLELNLHRVSLEALEENKRAIRSYEKVGFVPEGATRGTDLRDGRRDNLVAMGILRHEWKARQI